MKFVSQNGCDIDWIIKNDLYFNLYEHLFQGKIKIESKGSDQGILDAVREQMRYYHMCFLFQKR